MFQKLFSDIKTAGEKLGDAPRLFLFCFVFANFCVLLDEVVEHWGTTFKNISLLLTFDRHLTLISQSESRRRELEERKLKKGNVAVPFM